MADLFLKKLLQAQDFAAQVIGEHSPIPLEVATVLTRDPAIPRTTKELDRVITYLRRTVSQTRRPLSSSARAISALDQSRMLEFAACLRLLCFPAGTVAVDVYDPRPFMWVVLGELHKQVRYKARRTKKTPIRKKLPSLTKVLTTYQIGDSCFSLAHIVRKPPEIITDTRRASLRTVPADMPADHTLVHQLVCSRSHPYTFCLCLSTEDYIRILHDEEARILQETAIAMLYDRHMLSASHYKDDPRVEYWAQILSLGTFREVPRGQMIVKRGRRVDKVYVVVSGSCEVLMTEIPLPEVDDCTDDAKIIETARSVQICKTPRAQPFENRPAYTARCARKRRPRRREIVVGTLLPGNMICREGLTRVFGHSVPSPCLCQIEPDAIGNHLVEILRSYESGYVRSSYTVRATDDGPHAFSESTILLELDVSLWRKIAMIEFGRVSRECRADFEKELTMVYRQRERRLRNMAVCRLSIARDRRTHFLKLRREQRRAERRRLAEMNGEPYESSSSESRKSGPYIPRFNANRLVCLEWHWKGRHQELSPAMQKTLELFRKMPYKLAIKRRFSRPKENAGSKKETSDFSDALASQERTPTEGDERRLPVKPVVPKVRLADLSAKPSGPPKLPAITDDSKTSVAQSARERTFMTDEPGVYPETNRVSPRRSVRYPKAKKKQEVLLSHRAAREQERSFTKLITNRMVLVLTTDERFLKTLRDSILHVEGVAVGLCRSPTHFLQEINHSRKTYDLLILDVETTGFSRTTVLLEAFRGTHRYRTVPIIAVVYPRLDPKGRGRSPRHSAPPIVPNTCSVMLAKPADVRLVREAVLYCFKPPVKPPSQ